MFLTVILILSIIISIIAIALTIQNNREKKENERNANEWKKNKIQHLEKTKKLVADYLSVSDIEFEIDGVLEFLPENEIDEQVYEVIYKGKIYKVETEAGEISKFVELPSKNN